MAEDPWGVAPEGADANPPADQAEQAAPPKDPWGVAPEEEPSTLGTAVRGVARSIVPTTAGILGGIAGGALGSAAGPVGTIGGALGGAIAAGGGARALQDEITDTLGLDSPESRERDVQAHPYVSTAAELAPAAATLQFGAAGKTLSERLAQRLASGAALGGFDAINQGVTKGVTNIDPTQSLVAGAAGAAMPGVRPWAEGAAGAALRGVGASRAAARLGAQEGSAAAADQGVIRVDSPADAPDIQAVFQAKAAPSPGVDVNEAPDQAANQAFLQQGQRLNQDFPVRQPQPAAPRDLYAPGEEPAAANENQPWNINQTDRATREPGLGGAGSPTEKQRYGERTRLAIPDRLQQWRGNNPLNIEAERARLAETDPRLAAANQAAAQVPAREQPVAAEANVPAQEQPAANLAPGENLHIPEFLQRTRNPAPQIETEKIPAAGVGGQNKNETYVDPKTGETWENIPGVGWAKHAPMQETAESLARRGATEQTPAGQQAVLPGAERISDAELAQRRAAQPLRPTAEQKPMEQGIFGEVAPQGEMFKSPNVRQPKMAPKPFEGMIENAEQYKQNAKDRAEQGLGTQRIVPDQAELLRQQGRTVEQDNAEFAQHGETFDSVLRQAGVDKDAVTPEIRQNAVQRMMRGEEPLEALDNASADIERAAVQEAEAPRPQPLSAGAPEGGAAATYNKGEQLKHQSVYRDLKAELGDAIKKVSRPLRETFDAENISPNSKAMDAVIKRVQGNMSAQTQADVQRVSDTLDKLGMHIQKVPPKAREDVLLNYERGVVPADNPLYRWANEQKQIAAKADAQIEKYGAGGDFTVRQNSMFEEDPSNFTKQFYQENKRAPTLGEIMQEGFKLRDDFLDADGSPNLQRTVDHQTFLRNQVVQAKEILAQARETEVGGHMILSEGPHPGLESIDKRLTGNMQFYAPREVKLVFERFLNPYSRDPAVRNVLDGLMRAKTVTNAINLAIDLYHAAFMATEGIGKGIGMGLSKMATDPAGGVKDMLTAVTSPYTLAKVGKRSVFDAIRNPENVKDEFQRDNLQAMKDGGWIARTRGTDVTPELETGFLKNYTTMWKPMFEEYKHDLVQRGLKSVNAFNKQQYLASAAHATLAPLQAVVDGLQLVMHPFFNQYIPMLKAGAVYRDVANYRIEHPIESYASPKEARADWANIAKRSVKSADNAMGELNQSTLYWPPLLKYLGNMATVSLGWNVGNWRQVGSAINSLVRNPKSAFIASKDYNPAITTLVGGLTTMALANVLAQVAWTGEPPKSITDVIAPRTGGKAARSNMPERAILPGYEKDYLEAAHIIGGPEGTPKGVKDMAYNKLASIWRSMIDFTNNSDWSGHTIVDPRQPLTARMADWSKYFAQHLFEPIGVQNLARGAANKNSNISAPERTIGIRHAPAQWEKPQQYQEGVQKAQKKSVEEAKRFHQRIGFAGGGLVDQPTFAEQGTDYDNPAAQAAATTADERGHMTDKFKLPNHTTFSTGSQYHGVNGQEGGSWDPLPYNSGDPNDKPYMFTPGKTNLETSTPQALGSYFGQQEPNSLLKLPNIASPDAQNTGSDASNNNTYARGGPVKKFLRRT